MNIEKEKRCNRRKGDVAENMGIDKGISNKGPNLRMWKKNATSIAKDLEQSTSLVLS